MRISDWSSDVCSSDLAYTSALTTGQVDVLFDTLAFPLQPEFDSEGHSRGLAPSRSTATTYTAKFAGPLGFARLPGGLPVATIVGEMRRQAFGRSEEHTSELQSLMRISYSVFCLNKKN